MTDFDTLDDKAILITGGADGIGLALARAFVASGAQVFLGDLDEGRLAANAKKLGVPSAGCDVTDPAAMDALVDRAWKEIGPIDLVCANAGVVRGGALMDMTREDADWHFDVNVWGVLNTCRPLVRRLRAENRGGHILITGSEASLSNPDYIREMEVGVYHMTKHAVLALADTLRGELMGDEIGVSVLCPGPVTTELSANSAVSRARQLGGPVDAAALELSGDGAKALAERIRTPDQIAAIALAGLRHGLFIIPTHPHIGQDVEARHDEITRGLDAL